MQIVPVADFGTFCSPRTTVTKFDVSFKASGGRTLEDVVCWAKAILFPNSWCVRRRKAVAKMIAMSQEPICNRGNNQPLIFVSFFIFWGWKRKLYYGYKMYIRQGVVNDPLGQPTVSAGSDWLIVAWIWSFGTDGHSVWK